ncbi:hypothetical protein RND71_035277 [Anisodus tanguticus]|uniref:Uncharacterized protein n=1 Tax=Anisodus tanguticus TaxID=243964 RepID=A0AAE1UZM7_9SOLA|nr:hypothetical protein RND71_035277 [Anisodus tanguticus]
MLVDEDEVPPTKLVEIDNDEEEPEVGETPLERKSSRKEKVRKGKSAVMEEPAKEGICDEDQEPQHKKGKSYPLRTMKAIESKEHVSSFKKQMVEITEEEKNSMPTVEIRDFSLDEEIIGKILGMPTDGLKTVRKRTTTLDFKNLMEKQEGSIKGERVFKKQLKPEYQLLFELVKNVLFSHAERQSIAAIPDLYLMKALTTFTPNGRIGSSLMISNLIDAHERANEEINKLKAENAILQTELQNSAQGKAEPGTSMEYKKRILS